MINFFGKEGTLKYLLITGVALRVFLYITLPPFGVDAHAEVINFLIEKGRLPLTREVFCAMQPPLYYLLAFPFFMFDSLANQKITQLLSLLLAIGNLYLLYLLCKRTLSDTLARNASFLLAVFLHSLVTFSLYVSNDTLAFFMGTLLLLYLHMYIQDPSQSNELIVAILLGMGLLTKGTFLAFFPPFVAVVALSLWKKEVKWGTLMFRVFVFCLLALAVGSYKYLENYYAEGRFVVHNLDFFQYMPANTYLGPKSIYYFDFKSLVKNPTFQNGDPFLEHVYAIIFYATFWYKFMEPFNGFELGASTSFKYMGSAIYVVGLLPSVIIVLAFLQKMYAGVRFLWHFQKMPTPQFKKRLEDAAWMAILLLSILLVITAGLKYNIWVCFQSRLFLQAFFPILWLLYFGLKTMKRISIRLYVVGAASLVVVSLLYLIYYLTEGIHLLIHTA